MADAPPPDDPPPEDPRDRSIRILETRLAFLVMTLRGEFSSMGRTFGDAEFERLWKSVED